MATARGPPLPPLPPTHTLTPPDARALYLKRRYFTQPPPPEVAGVRDLRASGPRGPIPLRLYRPFGPPDTAVLLVLVYYHGGGHAIGDLETHDTLYRELANSRTSRVAPSLRLITVWVPSTASRRRAWNRPPPSDHRRRPIRGTGVTSRERSSCAQRAWLCELRSAHYSTARSGLRFADPPDPA